MHVVFNRHVTLHLCTLVWSFLASLHWMI